MRVDEGGNWKVRIVDARDERATALDECIQASAAGEFGQPRMNFLFKSRALDLSGASGFAQSFGEEDVEVIAFADRCDGKVASIFLLTAGGEFAEHPEPDSIKRRGA